PVIAGAATQSPAWGVPGWGLPRRFAPNKKKGEVCSQTLSRQNFFVQGGSAAAGRWPTRNDRWTGVGQLSVVHQIALRYDATRLDGSGGARHLAGGRIARRADPR